MKIYNNNGLDFYTQTDLINIEYIRNVLNNTMANLLLETNQMWTIQRIESPCLIPNEYISKEYSDNNVFRTNEFTLKPETTGSTYAYCNNLIEHQQIKPPFCVWQMSKSFRNENDQVSANVRLKEFYQQEFQCIVTKSTNKDYQELADNLSNIISKLVNLPTRVVESDRLPRYSERTIDIEVQTSHKWLEICSISKRNDVPFKWNGNDLINYEFAFGIDRLLYLIRG